MLSRIDPMEATKNAAHVFNKRLAEIRARTKPANGSPWYPYGSISNIWNLDNVLTGEDRELFSRLDGKAVADIGAADGDMGLFLASIGADVDLIDNPPTNMNGFEGARTLKAELNSPVSLHAVDLDSQFKLPRRYDFALFLGILYHLKNPFYCLEQLARSARLAVLSTKVTAYSAPGWRRTKLAGIPAAYLLDADEANNDSTNYWVFTDEGLRRLLNRTAWEIVSYKLLGGDMETSDPYSSEGDRRAFCLLKSRAY
jgi:tRNA (mo5U34)-methyltransferase